MGTAPGMVAGQQRRRRGGRIPHRPELRQPHRHRLRRAWSALGISSSNNLDFSSATGGSLATASLGAVGSQTYSGVLTAFGGTAGVGGSYRLGGGGGMLTFQPATPITGASTLTIIGPGTVALPTSNNYTGTTTISSGVAQMASQAGIPDYNVLALNGGTLDLDGVNKAFTQTSNFAAAARSPTPAPGTLAVLSLRQRANMTIASLVQDGGESRGVLRDLAGRLQRLQLRFHQSGNTFSGGVTINNASARILARMPTRPWGRARSRSATAAS